MGRSFSIRRGLRIWQCLILLTGLAWASTGATQAVTDRYRSVPANADGIGKTYMGRQIAHVMDWQGAAWLERGEREREERSDLLMRILALKPETVVADVGAGTGYYSRRIADLIGPTGKVYAVDIQPEMVKLLQSVSNQRAYSHIMPVLGGVNDGEAQIRREAELHPLVWQRTANDLPWQHVLVFKRK